MYTFLCNLRECILKLEFDQYDYDGKGSISSQDFAMTLVSYVHHKQIYQYVKLVKSCPDYGRVTLQEFLEFNEALLMLDDILDGLAFYFTGETNITADVMQQAFFAASGKMLPLNQMEILMHIADKDKNGKVDFEELSQIMSKPRVMDLSKQLDFGFVQTVGCFWDCFTWQVSSPETIFNQYASHEGKNGVKLMNWVDFRNACLPQEIMEDEERQSTFYPDPFMWSLMRNEKITGRDDSD